MFSVLTLSPHSNNTKEHQEASFPSSFILGQMLASQSTSKSLLRAGLGVFLLAPPEPVSPFSTLPCDVGDGLGRSAPWAHFPLVSGWVWPMGSTSRRLGGEGRVSWVALVGTLPSPCLFRLPHYDSPWDTALSLVSFLQVCKLNFYETSHSSGWSGPLFPTRTLTDAGSSMCHPLCQADPEGCHN